MAKPDASVDTEFDEEIESRLGDADLRYTAGRQAIVAAMRHAGRPLTLPELLAAAPSLAQSTAYRNLAQLEDTGVVRRLVHGDEHARFELAEALTEHHHHLICDSCGIVVDVTFPDALEARLDDAFEAVALDEGFELGDHTIDLFGRCASCR